MSRKTKQLMRNVGFKEEKPRSETVVNSPVKPDVMRKKNGKLSKEQINNWRKVLSLSLGSFAYFIPDEQIQKYRDRLQAMADKEAGKSS